MAQVDGFEKFDERENLSNWILSKTDLTSETNYESRLRNSREKTCFIYAINYFVLGVP